MARHAIIVQAALLGALLLALAYHARPDSNLHVSFLATAGDAALIQTPGGGYVLVDGGADPAALAAALGRRLPFWQRKLVAVVLTAPDGSRLPGQVAALARYHAALALAPASTRPTAALDEWRRLLRAADTPIRTARPGATLALDGATLRVLALGAGDDGGLMLRLDYGATSVVFDQSGAARDEAALVGDGALQPASLVAFPWQRDPHTPLLDTLRPQFIVFTDGTKAAPPAELTFAERAVGGAKLYHEQLNGTIEWVSDGRRAWVTTEK